MVTTVFSDISHRHGVTAFCAIIQIDGKEPQYVLGDLTDIGQGTHSTISEIAATTVAVQTAPASDLTIYTDQDSLPRWLHTNRHPASLFWALEELKTNLLKHTNVKYRKDRAHPHYQDCHRRAYKHAGTVARARGVMPINQQRLF